MEIKDHLHNFIVNNEDFERLEVELKRFNPFSVLKIQSHEIRHSNVLAWLLDPKENHNLGDRILKKIIMQVILQNEDVIPDELDLHKIQMGDYSDSVVRREENNIDIIVVSARNKLVFLIENKVYSKESQGQLKKYLATTRNSYPGYVVLPLFLTLQGDNPIGETGYCIFDYKKVFKIIQFVTDLNKNVIPNEVYDFVQFYLRTLQGILQMDDKVLNLCKSIYNQHKDALDTIFNVIRIDDTAFNPAIERFLKDNPDIVSTYPVAGSLWFLPNSIISTPKIARINWNQGYPIALWFCKYEETVGFVIEIGPFNNPEHRLQFLLHLEKTGFRIKDRSKKLESQYSRIFTKYVKVNDWSDEDEILEVMNDLYTNKGKSNVDLVIKAVKSFAWEKE